MSVHDPMVDAPGLPGEGAGDRARTVRETITGYIEDVADERIVDPSINLFESGLLTSLDVLSLVAFIEETFSLEISGDDIDMDSFGTVDGLVATITGLEGRHRAP